MKTLHDQTCPLCGASARFAFEDYENFKHFFCQKCSEFEISIAAERVVDGMADSTKAGWSRSAKAADEHHLLSIRRPIGDEAKDEPALAIVAKIIPRSGARGRD